MSDLHCTGSPSKTVELKDLGSISTLAAVGRFITTCLLPDGYTFPDALADAICLTPPGKEITKAAAAEFPDVALADIKAAALATLVARDSTLIDVENSNEDEILNLVGEEIIAKRIRYPWMMGHRLDQAYAQLYRHAPPAGSLSPAQSYSLLDTVPQGVFQIDKLTVGPFGLQRSHSSRWFPPLSCGPTYLCERLECSIGHHVDLRTGETSAGDVYEKLRVLFPPVDSLNSYVLDVLRPDKEYYSLFNTDGLGWLIGNGLIPDEQRVLLRRLVLKVGTEAIAGVVRAGMLPEQRRPAAAEISSLDEASTFQLTMCFADSDIIAHLESLVDEGAIQLSETELRVAIAQRHVSGGAFEISQELSRNGVSFRAGEPSTILRTFLQSVYSTDDEQEELRYQLRDVEGDAAYDKLDYFLRDAGEEEILDRLVFTSRGALLRAFKQLQFGKFDVPANIDEEGRLRARLLWKLGRTQQPPAAPDQRLKTFLERVRALDSAESMTESQWATIARSAGLDLFVELESVLAATAEFACWLLLTDHFGPPEYRFLYSAARARRVTADVLTLENGDFIYDHTGRNSLGILVEALGRVSTHAERTLSERDAYERRTAPSYAEHTKAQIFPFTHTKFVCDLTDRSTITLIAVLREAQAELSRGRAVEVRNRLGHAPASFPTHLELNHAADSVASAVSMLVECGLLPTVFGSASMTMDASDRYTTRYQDGAGREVSLHRPSPLSRTRLPSASSQLVIVKGAIIAGTIEPMRFKVEEDTPFAEYWHGYRDRRTSDPDAH